MKSSTDGSARRRRGLLLAVVVCLALAGCRQDMHDTPRLDPLQESDFFRDGRASRPLVAGTIPKGHLRDDEHLYAGTIEGASAEGLPFEVDRWVLERGRERFNIFCAPCHDQGGTGQGMVVQRGFHQAASLHMDRLREAPDGYLFGVITHGTGLMPDYRDQIDVRDRWAIIAYVRALQLSRSATIEDVPAEQREWLIEDAPPGPGGSNDD